MFCKLLYQLVDCDKQELLKKMLGMTNHTNNTKEFYIRLCLHSGKHVNISKFSSILVKKTLFKMG